MKCFLDLDGVITDFVKATCQAHGRENPYEGENPSEEWHMDKVFGMTSEQFWAPLSSVNFWASLEWTIDGIEILKAVEDTFGKENICILTSPMKDHDCSGGKHWWIAKNLPDYERRFFIGAAKHFMVGPEKVLIDDHDMNVENFRTDGGHAILVPRQWNKNRSKDPIDYVLQQLKAFK